MNVTLVKHAQDDVYRDERRQNQPGLVRQRGVEGLGGSLKGWTNIGGNSQLQDGGLDILHRVTQGYALSKVERYGYRWKLSLVVYGEGRGLHLEMRECAERHLRSGGRPHKKLLDIVSTVAEGGIHFHDDVILVQLGIDRRYLPLTEGVIQSVVDCSRCDSQPGGCIPVDDEGGLEAPRLLIGVHVAQAGHLAEPGFHARSPLLQIAQIFALEGILILRIGKSAAHRDVLIGPEEECRAGYDGCSPSKTRNDLVNGDLAFAEWFQIHIHAARVFRATACISGHA